MAKYFYPAVFTEETEGGYSVSFPDLPGCFTEGDTLDEAYGQSVEAIGLYLQDQNGEFTFPTASNPKHIPVTDNTSVVLIGFDPIEYMARNDPRLENMTVKIPRWVKEAGKRNGINFSVTLTEAIVQKLQQ